MRANIMMSPAPIRSAAHAASYYEQSDHADYYARDDVCISSWQGQGAKILGIYNQRVDKERFKYHLSGEVAGQKLGTMRQGMLVHKPAVDLCFAPPKSVSIAALVGGDERVIEAHNQAVNATIEMMERKAAFTRFHKRDEDGKDKTIHHNTGNLLCAVFTHETSRKLSPQLHSHAVCLNFSQIETGEWRSLEFRHFYSLQKQIGLYYRQQLSSKLKYLGYDIQRKKDASFEISGVPESVIQEFSLQRDVIDQELEKRGYTRDTAPAYLKEQIAHRSREKKVYIEPDLLCEQWKKTLKEHGFNSENLVKQAKINAGLPSYEEKQKAQSFDQLVELSEKVIKSITERDAVFSKDQLLNKINEQAVGYAISPEAVNEYVKRLEASNLLITRQTKKYVSQFQEWRTVDAYTTPQAIDLEKQMLSFLERGQNIIFNEFSAQEVENITFQANKKSINKGYDGWNSGQRTSARGVLKNNNQFIGIQGYAGTAKTSTVLRTLSNAYQTKGYQVIGMAPSSSACESLKQGAKLDKARTVASHLLQSNFKTYTKQKQLWLVDEASLISTKDMTALFTNAKNINAKVILVGDVKQLGSVEAGFAFKQLQENGLVTFELDKIVRQENQYTLDAVYSSIMGDAKKALEHLNSGGGKVVEVSGDASQRQEHIISEYMSLTPNQRESTLLIEPSREGRQKLSDTLRVELKKSGELNINGATAKRLEKIDLTKEAQEDVLNYNEGAVIKFNRAYKAQNVSKNSYWTVVSKSTEKGVLSLKNTNGQQLLWNPNGSWGKQIQVFEQVESELSINDKLIWTHNNRKLGLSNGMKGRIIEVDDHEGLAFVKFDNGKHHKIDLNELDGGHWNHNYVTTAHAVQGMTADRVIYHAESFMRNLASQQAFYVSISRAKHEAIVFTDNRLELEKQLREHTGLKENAITGIEMSFE
jgi:conjugative relaxase-like TrwC/TraI family protein